MNRLLTLLMLAAAFVAQVPTQGATIFESGTLGQTGLSFSDVASNSIPATGVSEEVFAGVRFHLENPVETSQVGGHVVARDLGSSFFGAIVRLTSEADFPDSLDLTTADVLGTAIGSLPSTSAEVLLDLDVSLEPGWYALVFGSGLFGATGEGITVRNGEDFGSQSYIGLQPNSGIGWINRTTSNNRRFIVIGDVVPEPSSLLSGLAGTSLLLLIRRT